MTGRPTPASPSPSPGMGEEVELLEASDTALLVRIARGRREALAELYRRHGDRVYATARAVCGPEQAEAATRDVFVGLWRKPETAGCDGSTLRPHLLMEAYRRATELRRPARAGEEPVPEQCVVLSRFGDYSYREVARLLGCSDTSVKHGLRAGLRRLQAQSAHARP
jgi:DNA-directed RNA polymerase specialized sigma24 family protein